MPDNAVVRTTPGGTFAAGAFAVSDFNDLPGGMIAYQLRNAIQTSITTQVALGALTLTITPAAYRILRISFNVLIQLTVASPPDTFQIQILKDGGPAYMAAWNYPYNYGSRDLTITNFALDINPTAASHTYALYGGRVQSNGAYQLSPTATNPATLLIEDLGPAFSS